MRALAKKYYGDDFELTSGLRYEQKLPALAAIAEQICSLFYIIYCSICSSHNDAQSA